MENYLVLLKNQFEEVASTRGKAKIPVIKKFATEDSESADVFKEVYNFIFNPFISSGIAKKKMNKKLGSNFGRIRGDYHILHFLDWLGQNNTGSDEIVAVVQGWVEQQPEETHEFLKNVITQDLQIGASEKALNEALGYEYIPVHEIMLAKRWEKEEHKIKDGDEFVVTLKMDDYRTTVIFNEETNKWELKARSGLLFEDVVEIEDIFDRLPKDQVYDGGLLSTDDTLNSKDRFRKTGKILRTDGLKYGLMFYIYDMLPKGEFIKGKSKDDYKTRQGKITDLMSEYGLNSNILFEHVPVLYKGTDKNQIMPILEEVLADEYEGLMVNTAKGKYETKRSDQLLKVKEFHTVDLRVIDTYEYKHPGKLGGFICEWKDGNTVRVGGGFKLHEREEWWPKREEFIGKIIEVRYFQESKNQNGGSSIRHGHFTGLRWDKNEPSFE